MNHTNPFMTNPWDTFTSGERWDFDGVQARQVREYITLRVDQDPDWAMRLQSWPPPPRRPRPGDTIHYVPLGEHAYAVQPCQVTTVYRLGGYPENGNLGHGRVSAESVHWLHEGCCEGTTIINDAPHQPYERGGWHWPEECTR